MSLPPQQFCVRWNSYHTNLQTVFPKLLTTENFVDVTLACENRQIKCHKVVLSACSTYFEKLLIQNPCKHPIIFMKDMRFSEMQSLVDFMYKGEVNVSQDDLPSLLKSAEALQIRGLCGSENSSGSQESTPPPRLNIPPASSNHVSTATSPREPADSLNNHNPAVVKASTTQPPSPSASSPASTSPGGVKRRRGGCSSEGSPEGGRLKQETVEEDGLYYGDMECGQQEDDDLLQTGSIGSQPPSEGRKAISLRVKSRSELCGIKLSNVDESLINRLQLRPQISFRTYQKNNATDGSKNVKDKVNSVTEDKEEIATKEHGNNPSSHPDKDPILKALISGKSVTIEKDYNELEEKIDEQIYEDEEYLKLWLAQNQELEVSMSNGCVISNTDIKPTPVFIETVPKTKKHNALGKYDKKSEINEQWLRYYTDNFGISPNIVDVKPPKLNNEFGFKAKKKIDKTIGKKNNKSAEGINLLDFLEPGDLDQFLAGKEVSSSGLSRTAIEQAMLGKYNPNRRYSNEAMWAALMDVKKGGSIYRAAQTHKVPRKSLRNWMKRWHIKSSFPMPQQLKQFVENNRKHKLELRREFTNTLFSLGARSKIIDPNGGKLNIEEEAKGIKSEIIDMENADSHEKMNDYYRTGDLRATSSCDENDVALNLKVDDRKSSDISLSDNDEVVSYKKDTRKNALSTVNENILDTDIYKESDEAYGQIMDMSGNILFDETVASIHDSQNDEVINKDEDDVGMSQQRKSANLSKKIVSFSNVEQLAGLDSGDSNVNDGLNEEKSGDFNKIARDI